MADMMVIVSKAIFEKEAKGAKPGDVYQTDCYRSGSKSLAKLEDGGNLYLLTVRPDDVLWFVGVLENPRKTKDGWQAAANKEPIRDVTGAIGEFRFSTGKGITAKPGRLGMSLQTPRQLIASDVELLSKPGKKTTRAKAKDKAKAKPKVKPKAKPKAAKVSGSDLDSLLSAWRDTRAPSIATVISRLGRSMESKEASERRGTKIAQDEWLELAKKTPVADRGALLDTLLLAKASDVRERVMKIADWKDDPRVVDALHDIVAKVPWVSTSTRTVWTQIFKLLDNLKDPRTVAIARAFDPASLGSSWEGPGEYLGGRLTRLADSVEKHSWPDVDAETAAIVGRLDSELPTFECNVEEQIAEALADPDDDEARLVLADILQEQADPRGELISLQHQHDAGGGDKETAARIKALLKEHRDDLLGPLAAIVLIRGLEFRLGFVDSCELKEVVHDAQLDAAVASPLSRTIRSMSAALRYAVRFPELRQLTVTGWMGHPLELLLDSKTPRKLTHLATRVESDQAALFDICTGLPALRSLSFRAEPDVRADIIGRKLIKQLEEIGVESDASEIGPTARAVIEANPKIKRLFAQKHQDNYASFELSMSIEARDGRWTEARLDYKLPPPDWEGSMAECMRWIDAALGSANTLELDRLVVSSKKKIRDEQRERVEALVRGNWKTGDVEFV